MPRPFKYRAESDSDIVISEQDGVRSLHLGSSLIQSAMKVAAPNDLVLSYTRCMMGFLLFHPCPAHILMIGLGGGSLAKFVYHKLPQTKTTVIEINPQIVTTAINHFALPAEDARLEIILDEGGEYVASHPFSTDIVMIDGFDDGCQVPTLCSQNFYNRAREALNRDGVLVANLLSRDKNLSVYLRRIETSFNGHVIAMLAEIRGNLIVFALKQNPGKFAWKTLRVRAKELEKKFDLPFPDFVSELRKYSFLRNGE
ncbi:MAG: polyamine aminopropyltransferase [Nitrosomonas sp.]|nr:polyamine aminopropyltransferase [Nitrosomonas sp.]MDP1949995.1 polyamine aminopropyltransferase [Nitrosomonas sp.]